MIGYCGLDCFKCDCFLATQNNDDKMRAKVAAKWAVKYHAEIKPEQINCNGCKSEGVLFFFCESMCEIRKCNIARNSSNCAECEDYKCEKLEKFISIAPPVGDTLKALRQKNPKDNSDSSQANYSFIGNWEGKGADSEDNPFNFFSKVSHFGENKYRMLILTDLDTHNEPLHVMDGLLENNKFTYTSDEGQYKGDGTLSKDRFEGYYKGPIDGKFTMWRINSEAKSK